LTGDRVHLSGAGYKVWTDLLHPLLADYAKVA
jgi:lysophospholipase L1-like esterase